MKLYNTIVDLIIEGASANDIQDAIRNTYECEIEYLDDPKIGPGKRVILPVAYGFSKRDNQVVRAYQLSGPSLKVNEKGIPLPDWRLFRLDRIKNFKPVAGEDTMVKTFTEPPLYNPTGDKSMSRLITNAKF